MQGQNMFIDRKATLRYYIAMPDWQHCLDQGEKLADWQHCLDQGEKLTDWQHCLDQGEKLGELLCGIIIQALIQAIPVIIN